MLGNFPLGGAPLAGSGAGGAVTSVDLDAGSYETTGQALGVTVATVVSLAAGAFSVSGHDAAANTTQQVALGAGSYAVTGSDATVIAGTAIALDAGTYSVTGNDLALTLAINVNLSADSYALSGLPLGIAPSTPVDLDAGAFALSGGEISIAFAQSIALDAGSYTVTGYDPATIEGLAVNLETGSYSLTGYDLSIAVPGFYERLSGREPVQIVEIQQPFCEHTFGTSPCTATGTGDTKCYNTRATCQDTANFSRGSALSLYFATGTVADMGVPGVPYIIPSLESVSTSPTKINLAASNPDAQGLGNRALCNIRFKDHAHTDRVVDPYVDGRSWNPLGRDRGTFWSRWMVRNKYRQNVVIKVYEGYAGQTLPEMRVRTYFLQSINGPVSGGGVTIQGKDVLARIEERKAQAPLASPGVLYEAIDDSDTTFTAAGAVEADYDATGTLRIGDEVMTYTGRSLTTNGVTFTGVTRGTDDTIADSHDVDAGIQQCLRFTDATVDTILQTLLEDYGGISASWLDTAGWAEEVGLYKTFYKLDHLITEPQSVAALASELQVQCMFYLWWDERDALVKMKAIRGIDDEPDTLTDEANILEGSFKLVEKPRERASQVWVHYDLKDPTLSASDVKSYESTFVVANLESEDDDLYGEPSIRKIYANWLDSDVLAQTTASSIITRYVDTPSQLTFRMDAKDRGYWVGDSVYISHHLDVDEFGDRRVRQWTITSAEEKVPGEVVEYVAEDTTLYGKIHYIMANGTADYPGAASAPFKNLYIGDADGLLSDGTACGRIA